MDCFDDFVPRKRFMRDKAANNKEIPGISAGPSSAIPAVECPGGLSHYMEGPTQCDGLIPLRLSDKIPYKTKTVRENKLSHGQTGYSDQLVRIKTFLH